MSSQYATHLRNRARTLREFAGKVERTPALALDAHGGVDTWRGPKPHACESDLRGCQDRVHHAVDGLRLTALRFEQRADEIDRADEARAAQLAATATP